MQERFREWAWLMMAGMQMDCNMGKRKNSRLAFLIWARILLDSFPAVILALRDDPLL